MKKAIKLYGFDTFNYKALETQTNVYELWELEDKYITM